MDLIILEQVDLGAASPLVGQTLAQAQLRERFGVTVLACREPAGRMLVSPSADTLLQANMLVIALGTRDQLQALIKLARG